MKEMYMLHPFQLLKKTNYVKELIKAKNNDDSNTSSVY